ncbi:MAG TPA: LamG domain-containing protein [Chloroflexota bacterium]
MPDVTTCGNGVEPLQLPARGKKLHSAHGNAPPNGVDHDYVTLLHKGDRQVSAEAPLVVSLGYKQILVGVRSGWTDYALNDRLAPGVMDPAQWHHLAASFDRSTRMLTLYLDGSPATQGKLGAPSVGNTLPLQIGRNGPQAGRYFHGKLDDVRIWKAQAPGAVWARPGGAIAAVSARVPTDSRRVARRVRPPVCEVAQFAPSSERCAASVAAGRLRRSLLVDRARVLRMRVGCAFWGRDGRARARL